MGKYFHTSDTQIYTDMHYFYWIFPLPIATKWYFTYFTILALTKSYNLIKIRSWLLLHFSDVSRIKI